MTEIAVPRSTVSLTRVAGVATIIGAATGIIGALLLVLAPPVVATDVFSYPLDATGRAIAQLSFFFNHVLLALGSSPSRSHRRPAPDPVDSAPGSRSGR